MKRIKHIALIVVAALTLGLSSAMPSAAQSDQVAALNKTIAELVQAKKFTEAIPLAQRALAIQERAHERDHPDVVAARKTLAQLYRALGRNAEADALEKRAQASQTYELATAAPAAAPGSRGSGGSNSGSNQVASAPPPPAPSGAAPSPQVSGAPAASPSFNTRSAGSRGLKPPAPSSSPPAPPSSTLSATAPSTLPDFPWPPPTASASYILPRNLLPASETVGQVADTIVSALERTGYVERSFFRTQADGVALVTRLEGINDDGTALTAGKRWPTLQDSKDLMSAVRGLFFVDRGLYRVIVFILQDRPFVQSPDSVSGEQARTWLRTGANMLPAEVANRSFGQGECSVLIYEFASDGTAVRRIDSRLTGREHLEKAGVLAYLGRAN